MTATVWPVDAVSSAPAYSGRMDRQTHAAALGGATTSRPLGARSGVRPGTPGTTVAATATTWTVSPHVGIIDAQTTAEAGAYWYAFDSDQTGSVTAADATYARKDIIWVRIDDPAEDASSTPAVVAGYTAGTASASPTAPATPARSMVLAVLNVPASGGGSPTVTWSAPYLQTGVVPVRDTTERAAAGAGSFSENPVLVHLKGAGVQVSVDGGSTWTNVGGFGETLTDVTVTTGAKTASTSLALHSLISAVDYDRVVEFDGILNTSGVTAGGAFRAVVTSSGAVVTTNVVAAARFPFTSGAAMGGSATVSGSFDLAAGSTAQPRLWVELIAAGTITISDGTFRVRVRPKG